MGSDGGSASLVITVDEFPAKRVNHWNPDLGTDQQSRCVVPHPVSFIVEVHISVEAAIGDGT